MPLRVYFAKDILGWGLIYKQPKILPGLIVFLEADQHAFLRLNSRYAGMHRIFEHVENRPRKSVSYIVNQ